METLFKLTPISEVDLTTIPNNEDYYCEVWVIDDETPIGEPTEKSPVVLRFKDGIFIDEDRETRWEPFEIASILLPVSEKQIGEKWINVNEILPDHGIGVIICQAGVSCYGYYDASKKKWCDCYVDGLFHITHWMPLPEPPKK